MPTTVGNVSGESSNRPACASCKHQRRRCTEDCVLSPYFPSEKKDEFRAVHRVFGVSNMTKMLKSIEPKRRPEAIQSFLWVADEWGKDPVTGPLAAYRKLEKENELLRSSIQMFGNHRHQKSRISPYETPSSLMTASDTSAADVKKDFSGEDAFYDSNNYPKSAELNTSLMDLMNRPAEDNLYSILHEGKPYNGRQYYRSSAEQGIGKPQNYVHLPTSLPRDRTAREHPYAPYSYNNNNNNVQRPAEQWQQQQQQHLQNTSQNCTLRDEETKPVMTVDKRKTEH